MMFRRCAWPFLFLAAALPGFADVGGKSDALLARVWVDRAADLLENPVLSQQDLIEANSALDAAGEFQEPGPDALYLRALIILDGRIPREGIPVRHAYEHALAALDFNAPQDPPVRIPFEKRAFLYASLALRLKEYAAYLGHYSAWPRGHKEHIPLLYAAARSALYLGLKDEAASMARRGESLTMAGDTLVEFGFGLENPQPGFRAIAAAAGDEESIESFHSARRRWGQPLEDAMMPWILADMVDGTVVRRILRSLSVPAQKTAKAVGGVGTLTDIGGDLALGRLLGGPFSLEHAIIGYTGTLHADSEYDGYREESIEVVNGNPVHRRIDSDQDGHYEWEIDYTDGSPVQIRLDGGRLAVSYDKGAYPEVLSMRSGDGTMRGTAMFHPGAFSWDPGKGNPLFGELTGPDWNDDDLWPFISRISLQAKLDEGEEVGETLAWLDQGYPIKAVEVRYATADSKKPLWIRELLFEDGVIAAGRRSFREKPGTADERLWELYERYEKGKMVGLAWDPSMQGTPLYLKDWALGAYLQIQVWNIEGDGWMDVRRFLGAGGEGSARELSITEAKTADLLPWTPGSWYPWE